MPDADTPLTSPHAGFESDLALLEQAARAAGDIALKYFRRDPEVWTKENDSPVSEADYAVDRYLRETLTAARSAYGWLSEETADDGERLERTRVFIVDPIDGTRAFVEGKDDWTISLAVVDDGRPVAAALFAPVHGEMFLASAHGGTTLNGAAIRPGETSDLARARLAGPWPVLKPVIARFPGLTNVGFIPSLAYRLALVADGRLDGAVARPNAHDWDLAAADLLVHEAGAKLTDASGATIRYNSAEIRHPALIAAPTALHEPLRKSVADGLAANRQG
ncbi:MAG: 3'(2'),5'-bisphosphate nucleotidase CysQ [Hyphomicrobiales bacterium]|nr:MAG: 3'(2'),5'-bisphosphate nucleotidase CysQ [Hyphomicrobiales bacterium]